MLGRMLEVTNTLTRSRARLTAPAGRPLALYSCGPTVYRYAHIGNLRTFLLADLVRRVLAHDGVEVNAVQNITDVGHLADDRLDHGQDKMLLSAGLEGRSTEEIAEFYTAAYLADAARLNLLLYDAHPRATEHVGAMLELIARLKAKGHAYDTPDTVYFDVRTFPAYGRLSGNRLSELRPGAGSGSPHKRFHGDFALWRKAGGRRDAAWDSPWGRGFPGWHIECSAMSLALLGDHVDVHLGGVDLAFPHHESEIAQSEAAVGHRVVDVWVHGEHLLSDGRKMSKSAGNFVDLRTLADRGADPLAFRLLCLQARYRAQFNFTLDALLGAERTLRRLRARTAELAAASGPAAPASSPCDLPEALTAALQARFSGALHDDLDTPAALRVVHEVAAGEGDAAGLDAARRAALLRRWDAVLGLDLARDAAGGGALPAGASQLLERRDRARAERDWPAADRLRTALADLKVAVVDGPDGTTWTAR